MRLRACLRDAERRSELESALDAARENEANFQGILDRLHDVFYRTDTDGLITMNGSIMDTPEYAGVCLGCGECVAVCPGLAINLVYNDYDLDGEKSLLMLPFELDLQDVPLGAEVATAEQVALVEENAKIHNPKARVIRAASKLLVDNASIIKGKKVLLVDDGPTVTHGEMPFGAAKVAAEKKMKTVTAAAAPKDIVDIVVSKPIRILVKAKPAHRPCGTSFSVRFPKPLESSSRSSDSFS